MVSAVAGDARNSRYRNTFSATLTAWHEASYLVDGLAHALPALAVSVDGPRPDGGMTAVDAPLGDVQETRPKHTASAARTRPRVERCRGRSEEDRPRREIIES